MSLRPTHAGQNILRSAVLTCLLLLIAGCANTQRTVEDLPGEGRRWDHTGYDKARLSVVAIVVENTTGDASIASCIIAKVKNWRFDPPSGGAVTFTYPFILEAR